jgi:hypothetical protein
MKRRIAMSGMVAAGAALLLSAPVLAYQSPAPGAGGAGAAGVSTTGGLPNTSADQPAAVSPVVVAGAAAGGSLILIGGLGLAYRRRR